MAVEIPGYSGLVEIGRGGFAVVYRGHQEGFGRLVAVKVLARHDVDERTRRRFARECELMGALSWHPSIVVVYDNGITVEGQPFITMEYLADGSLADRFRRDGGMAEADILRWGVQVCGALQTAHDADVLHRDLKPENVLLDVFGQAKLSDFGIAAITGANETTTGSASFTVVHVAPEIINGLPATERSDVYSLGSTLYQLLTGRAAFRRQTDESVTATLLRVVQAPVPDLRPQGVSDGLAALVESMMAKDPDDRPASAVDVAEALRAVEAAAGRAPTEIRLHPGRGRSATTAVTGAAGATDDDEVSETIDAGVTAQGRASMSDPLAAEGPGAEGPGAEGSDAEGSAGEGSADGETVTVNRVGVTPPVTSPVPADATSGSAADGGGRHSSVDHRGVAPSADEARSDEPPSAGAPRPRRRRTLVLAAAVAILVLVAVGAAVLGGGDDGGGSSDTTAGAGGATASSAPDTTSSSTSTSIPTDPVGTTTSVEVGDGPRGVAVGAGAVWVANSASGSVSRVSVGGDEVEATIETGGSPRAVTVADGSVWVTNATEGVVARIDPVTNESIAEVDVGNGPSWVAGGEGSIWVANVFDDSVSRIDPATNEVVATITVGDAPSGVAFGGGSVWVANFDSETVSEVDPSTNQVVDTIAVDVGPGGIATTDGRVWVADSDARTVSEIDIGAGTVIQVIDIGQRTGGLTAGDGSVWVTATDTGEVVRIDPATATEAGSFPVGAGPRAIAEDGGSVYTGDFDADTLTRVVVGT